MEKNEDLSLCFRLRGWARPCGRCPDGPTRSADSDQKILLNFKQYFAPLQTAFLVPRFQREAPRMTLCEPSGSPLGLPLGPSWGPSGNPPGDHLGTFRRAPPGDPSGGVQKWSKCERARSESRYRAVRKVQSICSDMD